ncbi:hybrid sensor histidine kinase/response regulator [Janthinobacterium agaricidamnosum]|uniref:histidine kinase n=1 Tax=Janthinobacterium agaricidamnosum NBRC 102515 = DSM 9628 TaxID=1349767 RepID=W0V9Y0_9BURK|nr:response regulator [Janthinobacterium agaricidamnosum]CDG84158.1 his Kinase A domain protein [Janthinobacterium agaricidamnosum NBRC 102515 = DSM 9628]
METRILIHAPTGRDAALAARLLDAAAIRHCICDGPAELARQLALGAAGVLTVEEALPDGGLQVLSEYVRKQPDWSDLPVILLSRGGPDSSIVRHAVSSLGNLTLLERPVHTLTLLTSVQAMLRARTKQYHMREGERRKDEFLASLGHELRNPLAPIKTSVALLSHWYPDTPQVTRVRDVIERQVTHLTRLVDDLLDVARITSGKIELQCQDIRFSAVIGHVAELSQQAALAKHITIDYNLPRHPIQLFADHARLVQVLSNILSNAVKFTPHGGHIAVRAWHDAGMLHVSIKDNGIGLEAGAIPRIFSMFEQSKTVAGQITSGLGIGLSLSRQFAEMHGGGVAAFSEGSGKGSEFVIDLPAVQLAPPEPAAAAAAAPVEINGAPHGKPSHVLVVDDNRDAADSLQALFQMEGFDVSAAYDGYAAVAALDSSRPDLIVMDLGMPGMDGYQAGRLIRQRPDAQHIMMIALTGWGQSDARRRTLDAGFDYHLIKPVDFVDIMRLVRQRFKRLPDQHRPPA